MTKMECDIGDLQAERDHARAMVGIAINLIVAEAKEFCPRPETVRVKTEGNTSLAASVYESISARKPKTSRLAMLLSLRLA